MTHASNFTSTLLHHHRHWTSPTAEDGILLEHRDVNNIEQDVKTTTDRRSGHLRHTRTHNSEFPATLHVTGLIHQTDDHNSKQSSRLSSTPVTLTRWFGRHRSNNLTRTSAAAITTTSSSSRCCTTAGKSEATRISETERNTAISDFDLHTKRPDIDPDASDTDIKTKHEKSQTGTSYTSAAAAPVSEDQLNQVTVTSIVHKLSSNDTATETEANNDGSMTSAAAAAASVDTTTSVSDKTLADKATRRRSWWRQEAAVVATQSTTPARIVAKASRHRASRIPTTAAYITTATPTTTTSEQSQLLYSLLTTVDRQTIERVRYYVTSAGGRAGYSAAAAVASSTRRGYHTISGRHRVQQQPRVASQLRETPLPQQPSSSRVQRWPNTHNSAVHGRSLVTVEPGSTAGDVTAVGTKPAAVSDVRIQPTGMQTELEDEYNVITILCSDSAQCGDNNDDASGGGGGRLKATVVSLQTRVLVPYIIVNQNRSFVPFELHVQRTLEYTLNCARKTNIIGVHTNTVGRASLLVTVACLRQQNTSHHAVIMSTKMDYSVVRKVRIADMVFDCVMPVLMLIISFSMGCLSDVTTLRQRFRAPRPVLLSLVCQFVVIPAVINIRSIDHVFNSYQSIIFHSYECKSR